MCIRVTDLVYEGAIDWPRHNVEKAVEGEKEHGEVS